MKLSSVTVRLLFGVVLLLVITLLIACGAPQAPAGPAGPPGPPGPSGPPGPPGAAAPAEEPAEPEVAVVVNAGDDQTGEPGDTVTLKVAVETNDGSTIESYTWTQTSGVKASISGGDSDTAAVKLGDSAAYKEELIGGLRIVDRFTVQAINPHSLEAAEGATFKVTVKTSSGEYSDTVNVEAHLPYVWNPGISNVPKGLAVLLHGKEQSSYSWTITSPSGSAAALEDASDQNPSFVPDVTGKYVLSESTSGAQLTVYAGTWTGTITGQNSDGRPLSDDCTICHNGTLAEDQFTAWRESGHAEIFTQNINNPSGHWSENCAVCHTVGYSKDADNGGWDEAKEAEGWVVPPHGEVGLWTEILADYPETAQLSNIQCESCHGPNNSALHGNGQIDAERVSLSSEVCGVCHGEPARHGRYQQWEESLHANTELAIERFDNASCARCHTAQGFLAWLPQLNSGDSGSLQAEVTWTADTVEPVTCAVCHDTHDVGSITGEPNDVNLRVTGNTAMLPSGFQALGVGRGALCMTCHNTRNGERNDIAMATQDDRAPHVAAQADVLMGENAYFVTTGVRSPHSYIENTCTTCHMVLSPPPAEFSYNLGGTNHSFEASDEICGDCHGEFDGGTLMEATEGKMEELKEAIEAALLAEIRAQVDAGNTFTLVGFGEGDTDVDITAASSISHVELLESHGRQAMDITVDGITYEHIRIISDTLMKNAAGTELEINILSSDRGQIIAKAGWNYFLLHGDGSHGIHNPSFTRDVINAAIKALK